MTTTSPRLLAAALVGALALALAPLAACGSSGSTPVASGDGASTSEPGADGTATTAGPDASQSSPGDPGDPTATTLAPDDPDATIDAELPPPVAMEDAQVLVGMDEAAAGSEAEARGWTVRVARADGEDLILTDDYSPTRVNVAVEDGTVTGIVSIG